MFSHSHSPYEYEFTWLQILIGTGAEKRGKVYKVWHSKTLQDKLRSLTNGMPWLWDGNRIAWYVYILDL
jgi:hypothetical protein